MDFLNKAISQVSDLFRSMTPGVRILAGLLAAVVVTSLAYLFNHQMTGGDAYLLGGHAFSANELPTVQAALSNAGLNFELEGNRIRIPKHRQPVYVAALAEGKALPINWGDHLSRALDSAGPFAPVKERDERLKIAKQQELALVLRSMKDVINATVQYDTRKKPGLATQQISTATVGIQLASGLSLDGERVKMIRHFVAGAFAGLDPNQVTVADLNGRVHAPSGPDGGSGDDHPYLANTEAFGRYYEERIAHALSYVPGVSVGVHVDLTTDAGRTTDQLKHDPKVVSESNREQSNVERSNTAPQAGAPGLGSQQPNAPAKIAEASKGSSTEKESSFREENNRINHDHIISRELGMVPKRVTVSIGVPSTYFDDVWRRRNPTPAGQSPKPPDPAALAQLELAEMTNIKQHIAHLLPKPENMIDPTPLVTVTKFAHIAPPEIPQPGIGAQSLAWLEEYWSTLGTIGLGLFSLVMLRSMVRSPPAESRPLNLPALEAASTESAEQTPADSIAIDAPRARLRRRGKSGENLRDDLVAMVREDPDAAAAILRGWIGNAT